MQKVTTNTNGLQTNVIMMFAAAILAAVLAVAVASVLLANRIDAISQNQQPIGTLAQATTSPSSSPITCEVPTAPEGGAGGEGSVLGSSTQTSRFVSHHVSGHTSNSTTTTHTSGNTGNSGVVNVPVNVSDNTVLNDFLNDNSILNHNDVLSDNTVDAYVPVLNLVDNQVGPTGILAKIL